MLRCVALFTFVIMGRFFAQANFLGGTISWFKFPGPANSVRVRYTFRLTWEKGKGPCGTGCSHSDLFTMGTVPQYLSSLQWTCLSCGGAPQQLSDINTKLTSVSNDLPGWEQGEHFFFQNNLQTQQYSLRLDGIPWSSSPSEKGRLVTSIDLRIRNDTNLPNGSPVAAVQPIVGIPFGCPTTIVLPIEDPDADDLQARLATPDECADGCTTLPVFILKSTSGTLIIDATHKNGYRPGESYRIALMIEDYPTYTIKVGNDTVTPRHSLSKIPLQFTIEIIDDPPSCDKIDLFFAWPTQVDGYRVSYPGFQIAGAFKNAVYLQSNLSAVEYMSSAPSGMTFQKLADDNGRSDVSRIYQEWNPPPTQSADNMMCTWGRQHNGITTDTRCVVGLINDWNDCIRKNISCDNNGTCVNLWHRTTCKCPHGFKPPTCKDTVSCADFPCKNNGTCIDTGSAFICVCSPGFTGVDCETEIDECSSNPCRNGGRCINGINGFICSCVGNFTGRICIDDTEEPSALIWPTIVACVVGTAALTTTAFCCWWCLLGAAAKRRREKKKKELLHPPSKVTPRKASIITDGILDQDKIANTPTIGAKTLTDW